MIAPHGGTLINRIADDARKTEIESKASDHFKLEIGNRFISDCEMIAIGGFSPLTGFMNKESVESVVENMALPNGTVWALPIVLPVSQADGDTIKEGDEIGLYDTEGTLIAWMTVAEKFGVDIENLCQKVYKTTETEHPGVKVIKESGDLYLAGDIELVNRPAREDIKAEYFMDPVATRADFEERGWNTVVAFQTRNPIHRAHEYLLKCALESTDGLLIHPLVGETKSDDIPANVRMSCYEILMENYFVPEKTALTVLPAAMRYAGPREAVHHMIIRQNYGCSHIIIGRDHAGVGSYYDTYEAQEMVDTVADKMDIIAIKFEHTFYCNKCESMASTKTCPHSAEDHVFLSGTKVREMLVNGERPPKEFSRPEVADVLIEWATSLAISE